MLRKYSHCDSCGLPYPDVSTFPRCCPCGNMVWQNPTPVVCGIVPVEHGGASGVLVHRRGVESEPGYGRLALPGGYLEIETWRAGLVREFSEETGLLLDDTLLSPLHFASNSPVPDSVILFATYQHVLRSSEIVSACRLTPETTEIGIVFGPRNLEDVACFSSHVQAIYRYFALSLDTHRPHNYIRLL